MIPYNVKYAIAWANAAIGIVCTVLAGAYLAAHPSWLTSDIALTAGIIVPITAGLATLLPSVLRTPTKRAAAYHAAHLGQMPGDL